MCENLILANGNVAVYVGEDFWGQKRYTVKNQSVVMVDGQLYTVNDYDEAISLLKKEYQPNV